MLTAEVRRLEEEIIGGESGASSSCSEDDILTVLTGASPVDQLLSRWRIDKGVILSLLTSSLQRFTYFPCKDESSVNAWL